MVVVTLAHRDSIGVTELRIDFGDFANTLVCALDREEIEHRGRDENRSGIHHEQQPWVINSVRNHPIQILLRVTVRIFEDAVINAHRERGDVARRRSNLNSRIQCSDIGRLRSPTAATGDVDPTGIDVLPRKEIIYRANPIPNLPPREIRASEISEISHHRMFRTDQVVSALRSLRIPELAAFPLADRIPGDDHIATFYQPLAESLVVNLSFRRMPTGNEYRRMLARPIIRYIDQSCNIYLGKTFKNQLFNMKALHLDTARDLRMKRCSL